MGDDAQAVAKLEELLEKIGSYPDPRRASGEWKQVYAQLQKTRLHPGQFQHAVGMRDVEAVGKLIEQLRDGGAAPADENAPDAATLKKAMTAFRKRAKLTRLDDESQLGHGPLSKGADRSLSAITPPTEWPNAVWEELVRQGKLRYVGHGMYEVAQGG